MSRRIATACVVVALAACDSKSGSTGGGLKVADSGTRKGSAGGFSAQMASEMAKAGIGEAPAPIETKSSAGNAGDATSGGAKTGDSKSGDATSGDSKSGDSKSGDATSGDSRSGDSKSGDSSAGAANAPGVSSTPIEAGTAKAGDTKLAQPPPGQSQATGTAMTASGAVKAPPSRPYMKPDADVAAIKLDLEPNWERDMGEAGTFSLVVKVPKSDDARVFSVRYGYEDMSAPIDCDQYRKFLEDRGAMKVTLNRQKGGACYIEGTDQAGVAAFRMLLTYGGKRLLCHGSLYKDPSSAALGDLRDKVLMQAKKICETLAL